MGFLLGQCFLRSLPIGDVDVHPADSDHLTAKAEDRKLDDGESVLLPAEPILLLAVLDPVLFDNLGIQGGELFGGACQRPPCDRRTPIPRIFPDEQ